MRGHPRAGNRSLRLRGPRLYYAPHAINPGSPDTKEGTVASTQEASPADPRPSRWFPAWARHPLLEASLIGALALTLHLVGNGRISLFDRDEPRYAQCTREMRLSGDWVRPTFNGEPRYHKPVL